MITTLKDVIYIGMKNDVSFMIDNVLNLYEHQSTENPNMPLRGVLYFAKLYQNHVNQISGNIYGKKMIPLPAPRYVVFCNDENMIEERIKLRLSDSFPTHLRNPVSLECIAEVINVNAGHNEELMSRCRKLYEYAEVIRRIREVLRYASDNTVDDLEPLITQEIEECIQADLLTGILRKHMSEVTTMLLEEYDAQRHMELERKAANEEGISLGEFRKILDLICRKLRKGKTAEQIAGELEEEDVVYIQKICEAAAELSPDYDSNMLYELLTKNEKIMR